MIALGACYRRPGSLELWTVERPVLLHLGMGPVVVSYVMRAGDVVRLATHRALTSAAWVRS